MVISNQKQNKLRQLAHQQGVINVQRVITTFQHWKIFPFEIRSGVVNSTEAGYKPNNSVITDYGRFEKIFTGMESILCTWRNSTFIYQKNKGTKLDDGTYTGQDQFYTKRYKVGDYWDGINLEDVSSVDFGNLQPEQSAGQYMFSTMETKRSYTIMTIGETITANDKLQFFVVFNDNNENIVSGNADSGNQDRQWLYISNLMNYYSPYVPDKIAYQIITFSSVNDAVETTGQSVYNFIQTAAPGSGYAFPSIKDGVVSVNKTLMRDIGVRFSNLQMYTLGALSSVRLVGHPVLQGNRPVLQPDGTYETQLFTPRNLFFAGKNDLATNSKNNAGIWPCVNDNLNTNSHPETTLYNMVNVKATGMLNYKDWTDYLAANSYAIFTDKTFKGFATSAYTETTNSNGKRTAPELFQTNTYPFWDSDWMMEYGKTTEEGGLGSPIYPTSTNIWFRYKDENRLVGGQTFTFERSMTFSEVLNYNSLLFTPLLQLPLQVNQWLPFALNSIPFVGKMLSILTLGIPIGFVVSQSRDDYAVMPYFNGFISKPQYDLMNSLFPIKDDTSYIPINFFTNKGGGSYGQFIGSSVSTMGLCMQLSDRLSITPWDINNNIPTDTPQIVGSYMIGQKSGNLAYIIDNNTRFVDMSLGFTNGDQSQWNPTPNGLPNDLGYEYGFVIDMIVIQALYEGDYRLTFFYDNPYNENDISDWADKVMIWQGNFKAKSVLSSSSNLLNWATVYKTNFDEFDPTENTTFSFPAEILPPTPQNEIKPVSFDVEWEKIYNFPETNNIWPLPNDIPGVKYCNTPTNDAWVSENNANAFGEVLGGIKFTNPTFPSELNIKNYSTLAKYYKTISFQYKIEATFIENTVPGDNPGILAVTTRLVPETANFTRIGEFEQELNNLPWDTDIVSHQTKVINDVNNVPRGTIGTYGLSVSPNSQGQFQLMNMNFAGHIYTTTQRICEWDIFKDLPLAKYNGAWIWMSNDGDGIYWTSAFLNGAGVADYCTVSATYYNLTRSENRIQQCKITITKITFIPR